MGVGPHAQLIKNDMPVLSLEDSVIWAAALRRSRKAIVFTAGVFDLLHPGHVHYLRAARAEGDALMVAVHSDRFVRVTKGSTRPINPAAERAELVSALECVDAVVVFDEETPDAIIRTIQPDVLVKSAGCAADAVGGRETVESQPARVVRIAVEPAWSSSAIIEKIKERKDSGSHPFTL